MGNVIRSIEAKLWYVKRTNRNETFEYGLEIKAPLQNRPISAGETSVLPETSAGGSGDDAIEYPSVCREPNEFPQSAVTSEEPSVVPASTATSSGSSLDYQVVSTNEGFSDQTSSSGSLLYSEINEVDDVDGSCYKLIENHINADEKDSTMPVKRNEMKIFILNAEEDENVAEQITKDLRNKYGYRILCGFRSPIYRMHGGQGLAAFQKWAEVILLIVSPSWISAIKSLREGHRENTEKYEYMVMQSKWIGDDSVNLKIIPLALDETDPNSLKWIPEIRKPLKFANFLEEFDKEAKELITAARLSEQFAKLRTRETEETPKNNRQASNSR